MFTNYCLHFLPDLIQATQNLIFVHPVLLPEQNNFEIVYLDLSFC